jgi:ATP-dependent DNA helicase PIF1
MKPTMNKSLSESEETSSSDISPLSKPVSDSNALSLPKPVSETNALSLDQCYAFNQFTQGKNLFITGPGGVGKTRLIHTFVDYTYKNTQTTDNIDKMISVCAMTGTASLLLKCKARTLHSWSGLKLAKGERGAIIANVLRNRNAKAAWKACKILIVDEVSMMSLKIFELCEEIARIVRRSSQPFGGIQVIFTGDFFQLPPVGNAGDPDSERFCFESPKWQTVFPKENHIELTTMFRQTDPKYIEILSQVRRGHLTEENSALLSERVKPGFNAEKHHGCVLTKLFPIRSKAEYVNQSMFAKIDAPIHCSDYTRIMNMDAYVENGKPIPTELLVSCMQMSSKERDYELDRLLASAGCAEKLELKVGAAVMCTFNIDMDLGICNGSQGVIVEITSDGVPIVKYSNGVRMPMKKHTWQSDDYPTLAIMQIPLCLAWALTIHKIQGASMSMAEMDLGNAIFEYGQTYVALSRIRTLDGLYLSSFMPNKIKANPKVVEFYESFYKAIATKEMQSMTKDMTKEMSEEVETNPPENDQACKTIPFNPEPLEEPTSKIISVYKKPTYVVKKLE